MKFSPDEYTRHYIVSARFQLMHACVNEMIKGTNIGAQ